MISATTAATTRPARTRVSAGELVGSSASAAAASDVADDQRDDDADQARDPHEAAGRPPEQVAFRPVREDPREGDVERHVELADRPDQADDADRSRSPRRPGPSPRRAASMRSWSGGTRLDKASASCCWTAGSFDEQAGDAERDERDRHDREQGREGEPVGEQPTRRAAVDLQDSRTTPTAGRSRMRSSDRRDLHPGGIRQSRTVRLETAARIGAARPILRAGRPSAAE